MDNGTVPSVTQPPLEPVSGAPEATSSSAGPNPAMSQAATFGDVGSKLREGIAKMPLLSVAVAAIAGLGAAFLIKRPKAPRQLKL